MKVAEITVVQKLNEVAQNNDTGVSTVALCEMVEAEHSVWNKAQTADELLNEMDQLWAQ